MLVASSTGSLAPAFVVDIPSDVFFGTLIGLFIAFGVGVTVFLGWQFWKTFQPKRSEAATDALAKRYNLTITPDIRGPLDRYLAIRTRGGLVGAGVGMLGVLSIVRPWEYPPPTLGLMGPIFAFALTLGCVLLGTMIGGICGRRSATTGRRAARLTDLSVTQLIAPIERRIMGLCVAAGVLGTVTFAVALQAPWAETPPFIAGDAMWLALAALIAAVIYAALPVAARRLARARAIAGDENALAWSDALAAQTLRDISYLIIGLGGFTAMNALMSLGLTLPVEWRIAGNVWLNVAMYLGIGVLVVIVVVVSVREPSRHVQRTLWPQFARDAQ